MESDESIDLEDSEVVNAYGSVVAEEEHETPFEHSKEGQVKILIHHVFILTSIFCY